VGPATGERRVSCKTMCFELMCTQMHVASRGAQYGYVEYM
jgi:hypothetical protein